MIFFMSFIQAVDFIDLTAKYGLNGYFQTGVAEGNSLSITSLILIGVLNLILNHLGFLRISKLILSFLPLYFLMIFPLHTKGVINEYYFWFPIAPIPFMLLSILIYDIRKEPLLYATNLGYCLSLIVFSPEILDYFSNVALPIQPIVDQNIVQAVP